VAITRARRGLLVLGHRATLRNDHNWAAWLDWVAAQRQTGREAEAAAAAER
jgi:superfamily I DNA and/or RNA helicase